MYSYRILPELPAETRTGFTPSIGDEFVDPTLAASLVGDWTTPRFLNQSYQGDDYAGRDDISLIATSTVLHHRNKIGPFYLLGDSPLHKESGRTQPIFQTSQLEEISPISSRHRYRIVAVAAAICLSFSVFSYFRIKETSQVSSPATESSIVVK